MSQVISSQVRNPEVVIAEYIKQLEAYIASTTALLKKINENHIKIGSSWKGDQYDNFTLILQTSISDAAKELKKMIMIKDKLKKSAELLKIASKN